MMLNGLLEYELSVWQMSFVSLVSKALNRFFTLFRSMGTEKLFCLIYVDDIIVLGTSMHLVSSLLQQLET